MIMYNIAFISLKEEEKIAIKSKQLRTVVSGASTSLTIAIIIYDEKHFVMLRIRTYIDRDTNRYNWKIFITFWCYTYIHTKRYSNIRDDDSNNNNIFSFLYIAAHIYPLIHTLQVRDYKFSRIFFFSFIIYVMFGS